MVCFSPLATWPSPGSSLRGLSSHPSTHPTFVKYLPYTSHASLGCLLRTSRWKTWCLLQERKYTDNHKRVCYEKCRHRTPGDTKDKWHLSISTTSSNNWPEYYRLQYLSGTIVRGSWQTGQHVTKCKGMNAHGFVGAPQVLVCLRYRIWTAKWQEMMVTGSWRPFPLLCGQVFGEGNGESVMGLNRGVTSEAERWMWRLSPSLKGSEGGYITFSRK